VRLVRFEGMDGGARTGVIHDGSLVDVHHVLPELAADVAPGDMVAFLERTSWLLPALRERLREPVVGATAIEEAKLLAPLANPRKILCCWSNFAHPTAKRLSETPLFFAKFATAIANPDQPIRLPSIASDIVVEPELAAIIGIGGRNAPAETALSHVAGYTIVNDVTAFSHRLVTLIGSRGPYMLSKTFDSFAPMGPSITTADEIPDPHALAIRQWLNGDLQIEANTRDAIVKLPELISYLSDFLTLETGDVILIGAPPPIGELRFLSNGDQVSIEIEGIGRLESPVSDQSAQAAR
jgi:2-keto-4-pentenoate hydratase/2-oxohepta-3-ene-1,7-dioic acid hydratase in catechol pathway